MDYIALTSQLKQKIQQKRPLVHHITNFVTMYQCARITAFLGASPVMAFAEAETGEVTAKSSALVINTGTLNDEVIRAIPKSLVTASRYHIPVVLDPVGINLSKYRHDFILDLLSRYHFSVIRCNGVELMNLCGKVLAGNGIDGALDKTAGRDSITAVQTAARHLARKYQCTIACTGETDIVADNEKAALFSRGSTLLPKLVGTGCMINSLIGAYLPVADSAFDAAAAGILTMCLAGERAESRISSVSHLGSFETFLMDAIGELF